MDDLTSLVSRFLEHISLCPTCSRMSTSAANSDVPSGLCVVGTGLLREIIAKRKR